MNAVIFVRADKELVGNFVEVFLQVVKLTNPDGNFERLFRFGIFDEFFRLFRLYAERFNSALEFTDDIAQTENVFLRSGKLSLGFGFFIAEFRYSCGFLKNFTAFARLCGNYLGNASLTDYRITVTSKTRVHKKLADIFQTHLRAVYHIFAFTAAVKLSRYRDLLGRYLQNSPVVDDVERYRCKAHRLAELRTREDNVLHFSASERL